MPMSAPSASSHLPNCPTLRPLLSSFPAPPSHIPASPATVPPPAFTHGVGTSAPNGLIRESWHSRYWSESGASVSPSPSDESGEEGEGVDGRSSTTATSVENSESSLNRQLHLHHHLHQKQAEVRADIAVDTYPINNAHVDSPIRYRLHSYDSNTDEDEDGNDYLRTRKQPIIVIATSFTDTKGEGPESRSQVDGQYLRFASAEETARLYRAGSTPSLSMSMSLEGGDERAFGDGSDVDRDGDADMGKSMAVRMDTEVDWVDDPDAELDLEDVLDLEADMDSVDDVIDLKTPLVIRLAQQDMMESLHGHVRSDSYGHVVGSGTGVGGSVLPYLVERDEEGSERHEHVEAEASTAVVNENGHGHGVPRLQKPPVGLGVGLKMRMQTKANLNVDVAQSPAVPEYPYTFPRVPPSPSCPASNPPAAWAGGAMSIVQTMDANGHLQAHIHDHDTGKDTIGQNDDNTHGDGGGGGMNMNESVESAQKPPRSPLFDAGDPFRREGRGPQTQTQIRAPMSAPASVTTTPSRGLGGRSIPIPTASRMQQFPTSLPSASSAGLGTDPNQTPRAKGVTMRTLSARSQSPGGLKALLLANPGNRMGGGSGAGAGAVGTGGPGGGSTIAPNGQLNTSIRARSGSASAPNTPTIRAISNGSTSISILPSPSGPGRVLPAPAPRPPSKALPPLPHLRASVVGGGGSGNASGETLKSAGSVSSLRSTSISSVRSTSSTASLRSTHSSSSLRVQGQGHVQSGLPTAGRSRVVSNASAASSSIPGPSTNANANTPTALPRPLCPSLPNSTITSPIDRSSTASTGSTSTTPTSRTPSIPSVASASRPPSTSSTISLIPTTTTTTPYVRTRTSSSASGGPLKSAIKPPRAGRAGVGSGSSVGSVSVSGSPLGSGVLNAGLSPLSGGAGVLSSSTSSSASISAPATRNRSGIVPPKSSYVADTGIAI
ncbi:hypothetical protein BU17DRAFT_92325 [Hysterangium stoloniferum]|nr:hypothetical protein BU17DRAFT_92325 [Hysterangium stoloniferum]